MNYMPEILKMLGVEVDEVFDIVHPDTGNVIIGGYDGYKFSLDRHNNLTLKNKRNLKDSPSLIGVLEGIFLIQKRPWKPKLGEMYYQINQKGNPVLHFDFNGHDFEYYYFNAGNMFKTKEEITPEMIEQIIKKMKAPYDEG